MLLTECKFSLYADDLKICKIINSKEDIFSLQCSEYTTITLPNTNSRIDPIESVHQQFLLFALRNFGFSGYSLPMRKDYY